MAGSYRGLVGLGENIVDNQEREYIVVYIAK